MNNDLLPAGTRRPAERGGGDGGLLPRDMMDGGGTGV